MGTNLLELLIGRGFVRICFLAKKCYLRAALASTRRDVVGFKELGMSQAKIGEGGGGRGRALEN